MYAQRRATGHKKKDIELTFSNGCHVNKESSHLKQNLKVTDNWGFEAERSLVADSSTIIQSVGSNPGPVRRHTCCP